MSVVGHKSLVTCGGPDGSMNRQWGFRHHLNNVSSLPASQPCVVNNEIENILNIIINMITTRISGRGREEGRVQMSPLLL